MKTAIVIDAYPNNGHIEHGVARTTEATKEHLALIGHTVRVITAGDCLVLADMPRQRHIPIACPLTGVSKTLTTFHPDVVLVLTEGPMGIEALWWAQRHRVPVALSYNTKFPLYVHIYSPHGLKRLAERLTWTILRSIYRRADCTLVATETLRRELVAHGFAQERIRVWGRGVDTLAFSPIQPTPKLAHELARPIILYVGRVSPEKNLEALLRLGHLGTIVVVGDGPSRAKYQVLYPTVRFLGAQHGEDLAAWYACADVFAFPSTTETFGLVMVESLASGVPVAAFPVDGPLGIVTPEVGCLHESLEHAIRHCLARQKCDWVEPCVQRAHDFSWAMVTERLAHHFEELTRSR